MSRENGYRAVLCIFYAIFVIAFLIKLNRLNELLLEKFSGVSPVQLLGYNDKQPLHFFYWAVTYIVIGGFLFYLYGKWLTHNWEEPLECIVFIACIIVIFILEVCIIKSINIPIFQAILGALFTAGVVGTVVINYYS